MKQKEAELYMDWAIRVGQLSTAERLKVGAVIVNGHFIAYGYNGTPRGWSNTCEKYEDGKLVTQDCVIHAEENALLKCANEGIPCKGGVMFVSHAPCFRCATRIIQVGITSVFYKYKYRDSSGITALLNSDVKVWQLGEDDEILHSGYSNGQGHFHF